MGESKHHLPFYIISNKIRTKHIQFQSYSGFLLRGNTSITLLDIGLFYLSAIYPDDNYYSNQDKPDKQADTAGIHHIHYSYCCFAGIELDSLVYP